MRSRSRPRPRSSPLPSKTEFASARALFLARADGFGDTTPLYAELSRRFADDPVAAEIVGPNASWDKGLRLLGGLHYLVLGGEAAWDDPLEAHRDFLSNFVQTQRVQTNEVLRAWLYTPLFLRAVQRTGIDVVDLIELGSSAGLLLGWDRYHYVYEAGEWGPPAPLTLASEERRPVPAELLEVEPHVRKKVGVDLAPLDVTSDESLRLLKAFVWAGHDERLERLDRAFAAVRADPPELLQGDYVELLPELLAGRDPDVLTIVLASATLAYLSDEQVARVRAALDEAGKTGGLVFVSTGKGRTSEHGHWGLRIVYYPGAEREFAGEADYHGAWLDWWLEPLAGRRSRRAERGSASA